MVNPPTAGPLVPGGPCMAMARACQPNANGDDFQHPRLSGLKTNRCALIRQSLIFWWLLQRPIRSVVAPFCWCRGRQTLLHLCCVAHFCLSDRHSHCCTALCHQQGSVGRREHLEAGDGNTGHLASGVDCSQVLQRGKRGEGGVVLNDKGPPDGLQHGQVELGQLGVLADLHRRPQHLSAPAQDALAQPKVSPQCSLATLLIDLFSHPLHAKVLCFKLPKALSACFSHSAVQNEE